MLALLRAPAAARLAAVGALQPPKAIVMQPSRTMASRKHKKFIKLAKGYRGRANSCRAASLWE